MINACIYANYYYYMTSMVGLYIELTTILCNFFPVT